jgi:hypothetical protein
MVVRCLLACLGLMSVAGLYLVLPRGQDTLRAQDEDKPAKPAPDTKPAADDLNSLALEVAALKTMVSLEMTSTQMKALLALAKGTADPRQRDPATKAGAKLRQHLTLLQAALLEDQTNGIKYLTEKVEALREQDKDEDIDDGVDITDAARAKAGDALLLVTTGQVMAHLGTQSDNYPDPVGRMLQTLEDGLGLDEKEWQSLRDDAAFEAAIQIAGLDKARAEKVQASAKKWLDSRHGLKSEELKAKQGQLEQEVQNEILKKVGPMILLRNVVLADIAELLSNPQLPAAIKDRLKAGEQEKAEAD